jgi:hypothetical protein
MADTMILPGVYIDVLSEGLIAPGQVTIGNLGVIGTAAKGPVGEPVLLSDYNTAVSIFGTYDSFLDPNDPTKLRANSLTLVRALELAFNSGATIVYALRVADDTGTADFPKVSASTETITSASGNNTVLTAATSGTWGNGIAVTVATPAAGDVLTITDRLPQASATKTVTLSHTAGASVRNHVVVRQPDGSTIIPAIVSDAPKPNQTPRQAQFSGKDLNFGDELLAGDVVTATYSVAQNSFVNVTIILGTSKEVYLVTDGNMLVGKINDPQSGSALVTAMASDHPTELPAIPRRLVLSGGANGAAFTGYNDATTYNLLLDVDVHIIVAAALPADQNAVNFVGAALDAHCQKASTDTYKRDRIAVVGSGFAASGIRPPTADETNTFVDHLVGNAFGSDRLVFVAPGILATSSAPEDQASNPITLPGAYTAAVIAGMLAALSPHISPTNKIVTGVGGLEVSFNTGQLTELVQNRVAALEIRNGIRGLRGQTTDQGAFREITTRRIVDYAKYGVRSAAEPFIGLLNNDRVRSALRTSINSFLSSMKGAEMLIDYGLDVSATREQQIAGIAQVTITLQPVFSINFIHVTMILS